MHRLRLLHTLGVFCALMWAYNVLVVQHGYACSWHAELFDYTIKETTHFRIDETPLTLPLVREDKGLHVTCGMQQSALLAIGTVQSNKVDILCLYPDEQMITARAITAFDGAAGTIIIHPVMLFFSHVKRYQEPLYRLIVDCQ